MMDFQEHDQVWYHTTIGGWKTPCKYPARVVKWNAKIGKYQIQVAMSPHMIRKMSVNPDKITARDECFVAANQDSF